MTILLTCRRGRDAISHISAVVQGEARCPLLFAAAVLCADRRDLLMRLRCCALIAVIFWAGFSVGLTLRMKQKTAQHLQQKTAQHLRGAPRGGAAPEAEDAAPTKQEPKPSMRVHTFYYPWYKSRGIDGEWKHWNHEHMPHWEKAVQARYPPFTHDPDQGDVGSAYWPQLGAYSSNDEAVVEAHVQQLRKARIGVVVVSWYPAEHNEKVDGAIALLLDAAERHGLEVCVHLEPYEGRTAASVRRDMDLILETLALHRAYHRIGQKPVFYAYDSYHIAPRDWATELDPIRHRAFVIALVLDKHHLDDYVIHGPFDAAYSYFGATGFTFCSTPSHWADLAALAAGASKLFIPCVAPGYDDRRVRPWNGQNLRERQHGDYYDAMWRAAIASLRGVDIAALRGASASKVPSIVGVTSFNEWHEGTQIEEAIPFSSSRPGILPYSDYAPATATFYLDKTRSWVSTFLDE